MSLASLLDDPAAADPAEEVCAMAEAGCDGGGMCFFCRMCFFFLSGGLRRPDGVGAAGGARVYFFSRMYFFFL